MELLRVDLLNWPADRGSGGWVVPYDDPLVWWVVTAVHARYEAPRVVVDEYDALIGMVVPKVKRMNTLRAYLLDLDGTNTGLDVRERVLLHQRGERAAWWFLREVTAKELEEMERYRKG
ncbi:hypothetical protein AB0F17_43135 [Nonomuraea sp. NPDC026600]|uniref:hypothetical protein n=1 Tax=Nonomuraea sp. NPDC026600 TaxID=3155363 RepID=UPI0033EC6771